jgi:TRAP transporter TAXI family solute receptor
LLRKLLRLVNSSTSSPGEQEACITHWAGHYQTFSAVLPVTKPSVQATKGSVENLNLLQQGKGEIAFTLGDSLAFPWAGDKDSGFNSKFNKLRGVAAIYPNYIQIIATKESGIKTLTDLKGKRLSVGAAKSGTELNARKLLSASDLA